jgi:hypothetical protein
MLTFLPTLTQAETASIEASGDNTIFEDPALSNGSGPALFAGRTNQEMNSIRRSLLYFDVAAVLPADAVVEEVFLTLYSRRANNGDRMITLHRLLEDWGEGASASGGGGGAPAAPGDATWLHTFYPDSYWSREGGQYVGRISASQIVGDVVDFYTWGSTKRMVHDVNYWLKHPEKNFGWILIGDESEPQTVMTFASRENSNPDIVPILEVTYR